MVKGFIYFKNERIPFVVDDYIMELFTDEDILDEFIKQYNYESDYILEGVCFYTGLSGHKVIFLVEHSLGATCYLRCYIVYMLPDDGEYDAIGFQSPFLDDVFRYRYEYLENVRNDVNLGKEPKSIYTFPFTMNTHEYKLDYQIGYDNRMGLLEDYSRNGEILISHCFFGIQECYDLSVVLQRLAMFMTSCKEASFKKITLYQKGMKKGWLFCSSVTEKAVSAYDVQFCEFDVMKYIPNILNNIAKDAGNEITHSIPLGYLGTYESMYSPNRFLEQVIAFEYLFDKLDHKKAKDTKYPLKAELKQMLDEFPQLLSGTSLSSDDMSEMIKEVRRNITHGYTYYYDFKSDIDKRYMMNVLDRLLKNMSLLYIGFSKEKIADYSRRL